VAFVQVTAEQCPALREAGLLWYKHYYMPEFKPGMPWRHSNPPPPHIYANRMAEGSVFGFMTEE